MRLVTIAACALLFGGCGRAPAPVKKVTTQIQVRDRLVEDLDQQKQQASEREDAFDSLVDRAR